MGLTAQRLRLMKIMTLVLPTMTIIVAMIIICSYPLNFAQCAEGVWNNDESCSTCRSIKMTNYHIVLYAESNGVKILFNDYSKENITFEELKTSILRRLGNVDSVNRINRDKVKSKQIITNSTSIKDMTEKINFETELHLDVREV